VKGITPGLYAVLVLIAATGLAAASIITGGEWLALVGGGALMAPVPSVARRKADR
jgi:hypothetical protein